MSGYSLIVLLLLLTCVVLLHLQQREHNRQIDQWREMARINADQRDRAIELVRQCVERQCK